MKRDQIFSHAVGPKEISSVCCISRLECIVNKNRWPDDSKLKELLNNLKLVYSIPDDQLKILFCYIFLTEERISFTLEISSIGNSGLDDPIVSLLEIFLQELGNVKIYNKNIYYRRDLKSND